MSWKNTFFNYIISIFSNTEKRARKNIFEITLLFASLKLNILCLNGNAIHFQVYKVYCLWRKYIYFFCLLNEEAS